VKPIIIQCFVRAERDDTTTGDEHSLVGRQSPQGHGPRHSVPADRPRWTTPPQQQLATQHNVQSNNRTTSAARAAVFREAVCRTAVCACAVGPLDCAPGARSPSLAAPLGHTHTHTHTHTPTDSLSSYRRRASARELERERDAATSVKDGTMADIRRGGTASE